MCNFAEKVIINLKAMDCIKNRRSVRRYDARPVEGALLHRLLAEAERTQTMGNMQLYSVVVTRSPEMKARLLPLHFGQRMVTEAPVVLTFCADFNRTVRWCEQRQAEPGYENFLSFLNAATDALLYCQTFCTLAEAEGLGLCFLGTTLYNPQGIVDVLGLPRLVAPVATITLGWPAEEPAQTDRLPLSAIVHDEHYHDYDAQTIDNAYSEKESLPENLAFVLENGKQTLAQVFTDVRYTRRDNETLSRGYLDMLRRQGFLRK